VVRQFLFIFLMFFLWCKGDLCCESNQTCDAKETCVVNWIKLVIYEYWNWLIYSCDLRVLKLIDLLMWGLSYYVMNTSRLRCFLFSSILNCYERRWSWTTRAGCSPVRGGGAGACRAPAATVFFVFWKTF
jgi:hypothetical protein